MTAGFGMVVFVVMLAIPRAFADVPKCWGKPGQIDDIYLVEIGHEVAANQRENIIKSVKSLNFAQLRSESQTDHLTQLTLASLPSDQFNFDDRVPPEVRRVMLRDAIHAQLKSFGNLSGVSIRCIEVYKTDKV